MNLLKKYVFGRSRIRTSFFCELSRFYASNCQLSTAEIDKILNVFANAGTTSPDIIDLSGSNGYPTAVGLADRDTLVAAGWTVRLPAID